MAQHKKLLVILILNAVMSGCAMNPARDASTDDANYKHLYTGDMRVAHEAGFALKTTTEESIAQADQALRKGERDEALFKYVKALESGGGNADVLTKVAALHALNGDLPMAESAYQEALKLEPDHMLALEGLGLMALQLKNNDAAKLYLEKATVANAQSWRSQNGLGLILDLQGRHMEAVQYYKKALAIQPAAPQLHNNIGYSYYLVGDLNQALDHFRIALDYDPDYERAWHNIGLVYARQGEYNSALTAFRRVMNTAEAYNNVGYVCMINGKYGEAEAFLKQAIKHSEAYYPKANENLARVRELRGRAS
jgi:Flp pilus assembly protein TadD